MSEKNKPKSKNIFHQLQKNFAYVQEKDFNALEQKLLNLLEKEDEISFPVPSFLISGIIFIFILFFPLGFILDPTLNLDTINLRNVFNFYYPVIMCILVFFINQKLLVPTYIFHKKYFIYFVCNLLLIGFTFFLREVLFFLVDRASGQGITYFFTHYPFLYTKDHFSFWTIASFVLLVCLVCIICVLYHLFIGQIVKAFILREQRRMRIQYELDFLKNQLSPHFLFNTLNNISTLIQVDPKRAEVSMNELSNLLRVMLYQTSDEYITIGEDVEILKMYGNLEKLRLDDSFDYQFDVEIENPNLKVAPLMTMPLMENAIKHSKNPTGKSFAHITIKQKGLELIFQVENSNFPKKSSKKSSGLGLSAFQKRLELLYFGNSEYKAYTENGVYYCYLKVTLNENE